MKFLVSPGEWFSERCRSVPTRHRKYQRQLVCESGSKPSRSDDSCVLTPPNDNIIVIARHGELESDSKGGCLRLHDVSTSICPIAWEFNSHSNRYLARNGPVRCWIRTTALQRFLRSMHSRGPCVLLQEEWTDRNTQSVYGKWMTIWPWSLLFGWT